MKRTLPMSLAAMILFSTVAIAQAPSLGHMSPMAVRPGESVDVTLFGGNLTGARAVWTSFPATVELTPGVENNGNEAGKATFRFTVAAETPLGIGGVRINTPGGVSNVRLLMIDDLPTAVDNGANKTVETAQEISVPTAVDGTCEAESYDYYKFNALAGERISVEVFASRLGSPLDPVVRLLDMEGRELAYSDDEGGIGADGRFEYEFEADGAYLVEVRDIRYQGGGGHRYRLRVGRFPLASVPFPLAGQRGTMVKTDVVGPEAARIARQSISVPADAAVETVGITARQDDGLGASFVTLLASDLLEAVEFEPNDEQAQASPLPLPGAVSGRFTRSEDRDFYQFEAKKGDRWLFKGVTRSVGSPTDLFLRIYKADGGVLAEADDTGTEEGVLDFTAPEDGVYRLMVEDLHRRGGPQHAYRVEARRYAPGFSLAAEADTLNAPRGGVAVVKVTSGRRDYNGPITLALVGAGDGFQLADNVIPEGKNETVLRITAPQSIEPGYWAVGRIIGQAKVGETDVVATASTRDALRGQLPGVVYPPAAIDGTVAVGIGAPFPDFFKLAVDGNAVAFPQLVGTAKFKVKAERTNGFDDTISLAVQGLPSGFAVEVKPIEKGQAEAEIVLTGPAAAVEGEQRFRVVGSANFQNQPKQVVLGEVVLSVVPPLEVSLTPAGPLTAGGTQKVTVQLKRYGEEKPAVVIAWRNLPIGVQAPAETIVPEGEYSAEFELTAAPDAAVGRVENISVTAATKIQGRDISVSSAPAALDVTMP